MKRALVVATVLVAVLMTTFVGVLASPPESSAALESGGELWGAGSPDWGSGSSGPSPVIFKFDTATGTINKTLSFEAYNWMWINGVADSGGQYLYVSHNTYNIDPASYLDTHNFKIAKIDRDTGAVLSDTSILGSLSGQTYSQVNALDYSAGHLYGVENVSSGTGRGYALEITLDANGDVTGATRGAFVGPYPDCGLDYMDGLWYATSWGYTPSHEEGSLVFTSPNIMTTAFTQVGTGNTAVEGIGMIDGWEFDPADPDSLFAITWYNVPDSATAVYKVETSTWTATKLYDLASQLPASIVSLGALSDVDEPPVVPTITKIEPAAGPTTGGNTVTITGTGFVDMTDASDVTFDGLNATSYNIVDENSLTAVAPAHVSGTVTVKVTAAGGESTQTDNYTYVEGMATRYQETDGRLIYTAVWTTSTYWRYSAGNEKYSYRSGASVTIPFWGTRMDWVTKVANNLGIASVSVDGGDPVSVDLYSRYTIWKKKVFSTGELPEGLHWVKISHTGTRNPKSIGHAVTIDAVDVVGKLAWFTRYQETDPKVMFGPGWTTAWSWSYSGGKLKVCDRPDELSVATIGPAELQPGSVTVGFRGACLTWIATKSMYSGRAWVSVDGGPQVLVDLYSYTRLNKQKVYSTGFLAPGVHTVTITWAGTKRYASKGTNINVDAFDILGELGVAISPQ